MRSILLTIPFLLFVLTAHGASLEVLRAPEHEPAVKRDLLDDQIPHSTVVRGKGNIASAYLSTPTGRYAHGVLGDRIEAGSLKIILDDGRRLTYELPEHRVLEDLVPRLVDLDREGTDEIVVVESDRELGASLSVYGFRDGQIVKIASTPFIGRANRWLNPVGAGDFNGDSVMDLALVSTPHIGGVLKLYSYTPPGLTLYAEKHGISTHSIGSTALGLGKVVKGRMKDLILAPSQPHTELLLLEWADGEVIERARAALPSSLKSGLLPAGEHRWSFRVQDGTWHTITVTP